MKSIDQAVRPKWSILGWTAFLLYKRSDSKKGVQLYPTSNEHPVDLLIYYICQHHWLGLFHWNV